MAALPPWPQEPRKWYGALEGSSGAWVVAALYSELRSVAEQREAVLKAALIASEKCTNSSVWRRERDAAQEGLRKQIDLTGCVLRERDDLKARITELEAEKAAAVRAERERCAAIGDGMSAVAAEKEDREDKAGCVVSSNMWGARKQAAADIAAAIRKSQG